MSRVLPPTEPMGTLKAFQAKVHAWMLACFGPAIAADAAERNHRFTEEALELVQACGMTASEAHQLVDYVYSRPVGEVRQEVGGVSLTLAALCTAQGVDLARCADDELSRVWTKIEAIRAKQAAKPAHSPLPVAQANPAPHAESAAGSEWLRVIDEALVTHHLDVAHASDSYETARRKMNALLSLVEEYGAHFAREAAGLKAPPSSDPITEQPPAR